MSVCCAGRETAGFGKDPVFQWGDEMAEEKKDSIKNAATGRRGETDGKFEYDEIDVDNDEQTKEDLKKIAEIEERNEKMERIRLEREKVVGADVKKQVQDAVVSGLHLCGAAWFPCPVQ